MERINLNQVKNYISNEVFHITDPRMDGFTTWARKQNLYEIKEFLDEALEKCPTYAGEDEWLQERKVEKAIRILGNNNRNRY